MTDDAVKKTLGDDIEAALKRLTAVLKTHPDTAGMTVGRVQLNVTFEVISEGGVLKQVQNPLLFIEGFGTESPKLIYLFS